MDSSIGSQTMQFLYACLLGVGFGIFYDVFRILRCAFPTGRVIAFAQDVVYFSVCALATFLFLMNFNAGQIRFYIILGEVIGAALYFCTLSLLIMGVSKAIIRIFKKVLGFLYRITLGPVVRLIRWTIGKIRALLHKVFGNRKKSGANVKYDLKRRLHVLYNLFVHQKTGGSEAGQGEEAPNAKKKRKKIHKTSD